MKAVKLGIAALLLTPLAISLYAKDSGWYLTRKSVPQTFKELDKRETNIRDLVTDCQERSISLSCHRAGKWFYDHNDTKNGFYFINKSCTLGRGYSCRVLGDYYLKGGQNDEAIEMFKKGCLREDGKSCDLYYNTPHTPKEKGFFEKLFSKPGK